MSDAVWAAKLHLETGTMLSAQAVLDICRELVELSRRHCPDCAKSDKHCFTEGIKVTP